MKKQIEQLTEMILRQNLLDDRILQGKPYPIEQMRIALLTEFGELMNELPSLFKHWKASPIDNREKALEELVDCFHFALSLEIQSAKIPFSLTPQDSPLLLDLAKELAMDESEIDLDMDISELIRLSLDNPFDSCYCIMTILGFEFEEVYNGYIEKNLVNHNRQSQGY